MENAAIATTTSRGSNKLENRLKTSWRSRGGLAGDSSWFLRSRGGQASSSWFLRVGPCQI